MLGHGDHQSSAPCRYGDAEASAGWEAFPGAAVATSPADATITDEQLRHCLNVPDSIALDTQTNTASVTFKQQEERALRLGEVEVRLMATGCKVTPGHVKLFVDEALDAPPAIFKVCANQPDKYALVFGVLQDGGLIASVSHQVEAVTCEERRCPSQLRPTACRWICRARLMSMRLPRLCTLSMASNAQAWLQAFIVPERGGAAIGGSVSQSRCCHVGRAGDGADTTDLLPPERGSDLWHVLAQETEHQGRSEEFLHVVFQNRFFFPDLERSGGYRQSSEARNLSDWVTIPAGSFLMGSDPAKDRMAYPDEQPQHALYLPEYRISRYPITNSQYAKFVTATGYEHRRAGTTKSTLPVRHVTHRWVSWNDTVQFCRWMAQVTGLGVHYRPKQSGRRRPEGPMGGLSVGQSGARPDAIYFNDIVGNTTPVGQYPSGASPYGVLDMAGNVWEWTSSMGRTYPYDATDGREDQAAVTGIARCVCAGVPTTLLRGMCAAPFGSRTIHTSATGTSVFG